MIHTQNRKAGGTGPPANQPEVEIMQNLTLLLLIVVILDVEVKIKIIVRRR